MSVLGFANLKSEPENAFAPVDSSMTFGVPFKVSSIADPYFARGFVRSKPESLSENNIDLLDTQTSQSANEGSVMAQNHATGVAEEGDDGELAYFSGDEEEALLGVGDESADDSAYLSLPDDGEEALLGVGDESPEDEAFQSMPDDEDDAVLPEALCETAPAQEPINSEPPLPAQPYLPALGAKVQSIGAGLFNGLQFGGAMLFKGASWVAGAGGQALSSVKAGAAGCCQSAGRMLTGRQLNKLKNLLEQDSLAIILKDEHFQTTLAVIDPEGQLELLARKLSEQLLPHAEAYIEEKLRAKGLYDGNDEAIKGFLNVYLLQMAKQMLYRLAIQNQVIDPNAEPKQLLLLNIVKSLTTIFDEHLKDGKLTALQVDLRQCDLIEDEALKNNALAALRPELEPLSCDLLSAMGIECIEDLRLRRVNGISQVVDLFLGEPRVLGTLASEILPDALIGLLRFVDHRSTLTNEAQARLAAFTGGEHLLPVVDGLLDVAQAGMQTQTSLLAQLVAPNLGVSPASLETVLTSLSESSVPATQHFWAAIKGGIAPYIADLLKAMALPNPLGAEAALEGTQNIFERIFLNSIKVVHAAVHGQHAALAAKVDAYERLELLLELLKAGQAYVLQHQGSDKLNFDRLTPAEIASKLDGCIEEICASSIAPKKLPVLMAAVRIFFDHAHVGTDQELLRKLFFRGATAASGPGIDEVLENLERSVAKASERQSDVLEGTFGGLENELLELLGLNSPEAWQRAKFSCLCDFDQVKHKLLPPLLLKVYRDFTFPEQNLAVDLRVLLFHNPALPQGREILRDILLRGDASNAHDREFLVAAGLNAPAELIDGSLSNVSKDVRAAIKNLLGSESGLTDLLEPLLAEIPGLKPAAKASLLQGACRSIASEDPSMEALFNFLQQSVETGLLKILVNVGQKIEAATPASQRGHLSKQIIGKALLEIFRRLNAHKAEIASCMHNSPQEGTVAFRAAFRPVIADLISFTGLSSEDIPGSPALKAAVWTKLMDNVLPDFIGKMYASMTSLEVEAVRSSNDAKLDRIYATSHPREAMNAIAQFTAESVQSYVAVNAANVGGSLYATLYNYLRWGSDANADVRRNQITALLGDNIAFAAQSSETMSSTLDSAKEYIHSILSTAFTNLSENIEKIDRADGPAFLQKTGFGLVEIFHNHVKEINRIRQSKGKANAFEVDPMKMLKLFISPQSAPASGRETKLPNLALLPEYQEAKKALKAAKAELDAAKGAFWPSAALISAAEGRYARAEAAFDQRRKELYFIPLAKKLLKLAKLNSATFPAFPEPLKAQLWDLLEGTLLPSMLDNLCLNLMRPQTLNSIMHSVITAMKQTLRGIEPVRENTVPVPPGDLSVGDAEQNRLCGSAVSEMLNLFPRTMSKSIFDLELVRGASEPVIGAAIRNVFGMNSMIERIDQILVSGLPTLLPGTEWHREAGDNPGNERFGFIPLSGERGSGSARRSYDLPLTQSRQIQMERTRADAERAMPSALKNLMVESLSENIQTLIQSTMMAPWESFCADVKKAVQDKWGDSTGLWVLEKVLEAFKAFWMFLAEITVIPAYRCVWFLIERFYLSSRADEIIKNFHMVDVHEQFLFSSLNLFIDSFEERLAEITAPEQGNTADAAA